MHSSFYSFVCFVINPCVLSANSVDLGFFLCFINFLHITPPPTAFASSIHKHQPEFALTASGDKVENERDAISQVRGRGGTAMVFVDS